MKAYILEATQHSFLEDEMLLIITKMIKLIIYISEDRFLDFEPIIETYKFSLENE